MQRCSTRSYSYGLKCSPAERVDIAAAFRIFVKWYGAGFCGFSHGKLRLESLVTLSRERERGRGEASQGDGDP